MAWVKLDDQFFTHPKMLAAGKDGRALIIAGLCFCAAGLTDGVIVDEALPMLAGSADVRGKPTANRLVDLGIWHRPGHACNGCPPCPPSAYLIHDFHDWQASAEEEKRRRQAISEKRAEAGRRGAASRWNGKAGSNGHGNPHGKHGDLPWQTDGNEMAQSQSPSPTTDLSQSSVTARGAVDSGDDDEGRPQPGPSDQPEPVDRLAIAARILGARDYQRALDDGIEIHDAARASYQGRCVESWLAGGRRHDELVEAAARLPRLDGQALADHVDPATNPFLAGQSSTPGPAVPAAPRVCERCENTNGLIEVPGPLSPNGQQLPMAVQCDHEPVARPVLRAVPDLPASAAPCPQEAPDDPTAGASTPETVLRPSRASRHLDAGGVS